jgi:integrase
MEVLTAAEIARLNRADEVIFPGVRGKALSDATLLKVLHKAGGTGLTVHGFRSSFRDWAAEQTNIPGEVVEAALAHRVQNKVEAAYRRTNYLEKRRGLMVAWGSFVAGEGSEVLRLRRA